MQWCERRELSKVKASPLHDLVLRAGVLELHPRRGLDQEAQEAAEDTVWNYSEEKRSAVILVVFHTNLKVLPRGGVVRWNQEQLEQLSH